MGDVCGSIVSALVESALRARGIDETTRSSERVGGTGSVGGGGIESDVQVAVVDFGGMGCGMLLPACFFSQASRVDSSTGQTPLGGSSADIVKLREERGGRGV